EADEAQSCVIGYGDRRHHHADWQLFIRPLLNVLDSYTHVRAEFVNYAPEELARHPKVRVLPLFEDLHAYYEFLRRARWTIGLAPLVDTSFNRGKTNNKYREYAGLGIPGIYSDIPVYSSCIRHGETGYLTPPSEQGFYEALHTMIESPSLRSTIRRSALQDASSTYSLQGAQLQFLQEVSLLAIRKQYKKWHKPTLLIVGFDQASSMHIGALQPSRRLAQQELLQFSWVQPADLTERHIDGIDAVYVVRAFEPVTLPLLDWVRMRGVPVISSWDDDFLSIPSGTPLGNYYGHPEVVSAIKRFLTASSLIIASTAPLVRRSREFNDNVMESLYGLDVASLSAGTDRVWPPTCADGKIRIGFYGVNTGINEPWMIEALRKLRGHYGTRIVLEIIGQSP